MATARDGVRLELEVLKRRRPWSTTWDGRLAKTDVEEI